MTQTDHSSGQVFKIDVQLPTCWRDLNDGQLEYLAGLFLGYKEKNTFLTRCFLYFSEWKIIRWRMVIEPGNTYFYFRDRNKQTFKLGVDIFTELVKNLEWITKSFWLSRYVPTIEGFKTPNLMLYNATLEQYLTADNYYTQFVSTGDFKDLDRMIAVLFCQHFKELEIKKATRKVSRKKKEIRYAAFLWYSGLKMWIRNKYPYVFATNENGTEETAPDESIMQLLSSLNGGDITNNEMILNTPVHQALFELNLKIENSKSMRHV